MRKLLITATICITVIASVYAARNRVKDIWPFVAVSIADLQVETKDSSGSARVCVITPEKTYSLKVPADDSFNIRDVTDGISRLKIKTNGQLKVNDLSGTYGGGQATVCVNDDGTLVAVDGACS